MYLLKRTISPYTSHDVLLGCFSSRGKAQAAREQYLKRYQDQPNDDRWKEQAYKDVELQKDVVIISDIPEIQVQPKHEEVFVLSSFAEGFGQIIRTFHMVCGTLETAQKKAKKLEKGFEGNFPEYCQIQKVVVDKLLSDEKTQFYSDII